MIFLDLGSGIAATWFTVSYKIEQQHRIASSRANLTWQQRTAEAKWRSKAAPSTVVLRC
jgi:hypothetical protein